MSIPTSFSFGLKPSIPKTRSYQSTFQTQGQSYSCSSSTTARLDIPQLANTFLDPSSSYLRFQITNNGANAIQLDHIASCIIRRLTVYSLNLGNVLEDIGQYHMLMNLLVDINTSANSLAQNWSVCLGSSEASIRQGASIAAGASATFSIPLLGILGLNMPKMLPASGFTAMVQFEDVQYAFVGTTALATATISNIYYVAQLHQVEPQIYSMLVNTNGGQTLIPSKSYQAFSSTISSGSSSAVVNLGCRRSSVTDVLFTTRRNDTYATFTSPSLTDRQGSLGGLLSGVQLRVGGDLVPAFGPITTFDSMYVELQRSQHLLAVNNESLIGATSYNYNTAFTTASRANFGSWAAGFDLEPVGREYSDRILSGVNMSALVVFQILLTYSTATTVAGVLDCWVGHDIVLQFSGNNQVTVSN